MTWLTRMLGAEERSTGPVTSYVLQNLFGSMFTEGEDSHAGPPVTVNSSLGLASVFAAVRVLSEAVGSLPLHVYQRKATGRAKAIREPAYRLLHDRPNPEMTAMDFLSLLMAHLNLWGNAYIGKQRTPSGRIIRALWPIRPDRVSVRRIDGQIVYFVDGTEYPAGDIIHIRGISLDGLVGLSPIAVARDTIGLGLSLDRHGANTMRDRAVPQGIVKMKKPMTDKTARDRFRAEWEVIHKTRGRVAILDDEAEYQAITMPLADAQYIEQKRFTIQEIARIFRLPPSMIGGTAGDSLTYKTVEGDMLHCLQHSLVPWLVRIEQALANDPELFPELDGSLYPEFLVDAMLRSDTLTRAKANSISTAGAPWATGAEIRDQENSPPDDRFDVVAAPKPVSAAGSSEVDGTVTDGTSQGA